MPGNSRTVPDLLMGPRAALVIATNTFEDATLRELRAPVKGADDLAQVLENRAIGRFKVRQEIDQPVHQIQMAISDFLADRGGDDLLVLFLSCHGVRDRRGRLYFTARDTRTERLAATGLESRWLLEQLDECPARRQVLILDCCYSGAFAEGAMSQAAGELGERDLSERIVGHGRGRAVLTASRAYEYSFEGQPLPGARPMASVFTTGLVEGLSTGAADSNNDGYISVEEAYNYAFDYVQRHNAAQTPQRWLYGGESVIWLAASRTRGSVRLARVSAEMRQDLDAGSLDEGLGAVTELREWLASGDAAKVITARQELERIAREGGPLASYAKAVLTQTTSRPPRSSSDPIRTIDTRQRAWVRSVAFSPDGLWLAAGDDSGEVGVWNINTGEQRHSLTGHRDWVQSVAFSPTGDLLISAADDGIAKLWDMATGQIVQNLVGHRGPVNSAIFGHDGASVMTASKDATIKIWDVVTATVGRTFDSVRSIAWSLAVSPDNSWLASAHDDGLVRLWDLATGHMVRTLPDHHKAVRCVAFAPDGSLLAGGGDDARANVWDAGAGNLLHSLQGHEGSIHALAFHPKGNLLASAADDGDIRLWDPATGQLLTILSGHRGWIRGLTFSPGGGLLASAGKDRSIKLWNLIPQA